MADHNVEAEFVGQLLQFAFPQPHPRAVATASVGGDQQSGCLGIACPTDGLPPLADAIDGKSGRVMVNADTHPTRIGSVPLGVVLSSYITVSVEPRIVLGRTQCGRVTWEACTRLLTTVHGKVAVTRRLLLTRLQLTTVVIGVVAVTPDTSPMRIGA
jgi:hypothetical protein